MKPEPHQPDFFAEPVFPTRYPVEHIDIERFRARLKREMARAIRECPYDRATVAARMSAYLGLPVTKASLDAYTAESKEGRDVSLPRFKAFVRATGSFWLWDIVVSDDGLLLLQGEEAKLAEIARLRQEQRKLAAEIRKLTAAPVHIKRGAR